MMGLACLYAAAFSLELDSIREWGRFARFCIDTYEWADTTFNGYDTIFVKNVPYDFDVRIRTTSVDDGYSFYLPGRVSMISSTLPNTTAGVFLAFLGVSAGYERDVSSILHSGNSGQRGRRFSIGVNTGLMSLSFSTYSYDGGMRIHSFNSPDADYRPELDFHGIAANSWKIEGYYFFNHKRYSQAAAFSFSREQVISQGSLYAGLSYISDNYDFDFSSLPPYMKAELPSSWTDYRYNTRSRDVLVKVGYGYNWAFAPHFLVGVQESPSLGVRIGVFNDPSMSNNVSLSFDNQLRASVVWSRKAWFAAIVGEFDTAVFYDRESVFQKTNLRLETHAGFRFNLW